MTEQFLFSLCLGTFACLMPAAAYCLVMANVNGKTRPTSASGSWDCAGMLLALSGFLLIGIPTMLTTLDPVSRMMWVDKSPDRAVDELRSMESSWTYIWVGYFAALVAFSGVMIYLRRKVTVIYQLDPELAVDLLEEAAKRSGRDVRVENGSVAVMPKPGESRGEVRVDSFRSARTVTLHWRDSDPAVRREVEAELDKLLADTVGPPNATAGWLMTVAACLSFVMLFCVLLVLVLLFQ